MSKKNYLSLRFKLADKCESYRMNFEEWKEFRENRQYFDSSDDFLVEAAVEYQRDICDSDIVEKNEYIFNEKEFNEQCKKIKGLHKIKDILKGEKCNMSLEIEDGDFHVSVKDVPVLISYYPPYILSFDVTYQSRITVDLSLSPTITYMDGTLGVKYD